jgi:hypothetical protein
MKIFRVVCTILLFSQIIFAQTTIQYTPEFTPFGLCTIPVGFFGMKSGDRAGSALTGFGAGADFALVTDKHISMVATLIYSPNKIDEEEWRKEAQVPDDVQTDFGSYESLFLLGGARIEYPVANNYEIFGMAQVGMLFEKYPALNAKNDINRLTATSSSSSSFAFSGGLGMKLFKSYHLSARYFYGNPEFKQDITSTLWYYYIIASGKQSISMVMIIAGYVF